MKRYLTAIALLLYSIVAACGSHPETIKLPAPDLSRPTTLMSALQERQSIRAFGEKTLSLRDLGDLLWAAAGVNRQIGPMGKPGRTAPSAMNRQDITLFVLLPDGCYRYNFSDHSIELVCEGDFRQKAREAMPAANIVLVADKKSDWAMIDAGYISQNIYLFAAANSMATVACGSMDRDALTKALRLSPEQHIAVQHPVGYRK